MTREQGKVPPHCSFLQNGADGWKDGPRDMKGWAVPAIGWSVSDGLGLLWRPQSWPALEESPLLQHSATAPAPVITGATGPGSADLALDG